MSKREIVRRERVSWEFVLKWTKSPDQDFTVDGRGWPRGRRRVWTKETEKRIRSIHGFLSDNWSYTGSQAVIIEWGKRHPGDDPPPLRTVDQIMKDLHLSTNRKKRNRRGTAKYLLYPEHTIYSLLGGRVLEADFVGHKFLKGRSKPVNFVGFSFKKAPRLRHYQRVEGQTTNCFIRECTRFFERFETPDYLKVDNCMATIGSANVKRNISRTMEFLLRRQITPIFSVPRKPFSQASIEGNNSVFARKFWNRHTFQNLNEVDVQLEKFNQESQGYLQYQKPEKPHVEKQFTPRIYFIRQVKENKKLKRDKGYIEVLNEKIKLPTAYINYYVLAEWNLQKEQITIRLEKDQTPKTIKETTFKIDEKSKNRCIGFI